MAEPDFPNGVTSSRDETRALFEKFLEQLKAMNAPKNVVSSADKEFKKLFAEMNRAISEYSQAIKEMKEVGASKTVLENAKKTLEPILHAQARSFTDSVVQLSESIISSNKTLFTAQKTDQKTAKKEKETEDLKAQAAKEKVENDRKREIEKLRKEGVQTAEEDEKKRKQDEEESLNPLTRLVKAMKEQQKEIAGNATENTIDSFLGVGKLITKPIEDLTGFSISKSAGDAIRQGIQLKKEKKEAIKKNKQDLDVLNALRTQGRISEEEFALQKKAHDDELNKTLEKKSPFEKVMGKVFGKKVAPALDPNYRGTPNKTTLKNAGPIGVVGVYLGEKLDKNTAVQEKILKTEKELKDSQDTGNVGNLLGDVLGGGGKGGKGGLGGKLGGLSTKLGAFLLGSGGAALAGGGLLLGGGLLAAKDIGDSQKQFQQGDIGGGIKTSLLGSRDKTTDQSAGGDAATQALKYGALAGGAAMVAGAVGGAGLVAAGIAALPVTVTAAALAATAAGIDTAYKLGWDKRAKELNVEASRVMTDDRSNIFEKTGSFISSGWQNFTGTWAGGIRGAVEKNNEEIQKYVDQQAKSGNEKDKELSALLKDPAFQQLQEGDKRELLKQKRLLTAYDEAQQHGTNILDGFLSFMKGTNETLIKQQRGQNQGQFEGQVINEYQKYYQSLTQADLDALKKTEEYKAALKEKNGNEEQAIYQTFYNKKLAEAKTKGLVTADGVFKTNDEIINNYLATAWKATTDFASKTFDDVSKSLGKAGNDLFKEGGKVAKMFGIDKFYSNVSKGFSSFLDRVQKKGFLETAAEYIMEFIKGIGEFFSNFGKGFMSFLGDVGKGIGDFFNPGSTKSTSVHDAIIRKDGSIVHTDPNDHIIATKNNPQNLTDVMTRADRESSIARTGSAIGMPSSNFDSAPIVAAIERLISVVQKKDFNLSMPSAPTQSNPLGLNQLRMGAI